LLGGNFLRVLEEALQVRLIAYFEQEILFILHKLVNFCIKDNDKVKQIATLDE